MVSEPPGASVSSAAERMTVLRRFFLEDGVLVFHGGGVCRQRQTRHFNMSSYCNRTVKGCGLWPPNRTIVKDVLVRVVKNASQPFGSQSFEGRPVFRWRATALAELCR